MGHDKQPELPFSRSTQLALRRQIELPPGEKFLLWLIDDHIGPYRSWTMTMTQLQEESGYSRSAVYNYVNRLNERGLIWWDEMPDKRREFRVCWPNVAEAIEAQATARSASTSPPGGKPVHHVDSESTQWTPESTTWTPSPPNGRPSPRGGLHIMNSAPLSAPLSAPSAPSSAPPVARTDEDDDLTCGPRREDVLRSLQGTGVREFVGAVDLAQANGVTLAQVAAVVEHYQTHPGRWPPEVLYARLTRPEAAFTDADQGWYGENPAWLSRQRHDAQQRSQQAARDSPRQVDPAEVERWQRLEAEFGPTLDGMSPSEAAGLLPDDSPLRRLVARDGPKSKLCRASLLTALQQLKGR